MNRNLDAQIAETIYNWKPCPVGPDANGQNAGEILTQSGELPKWLTLPNTGKLHKGYLCPNFTSNLYAALELAKHVELPVPLYKVPLDPTAISQACLNYFLHKTLPDW